MINQELVRQARQTDLVAYLTAKGEELQRIGKNYILQKHDSLYIKGNMFIWYSKNKQGNPIDFLMCYYGITFQQAVEELTKTLTDIQTLSYEPSEPLQATIRATDEKRVIAYLCKRRGLKNSLIFDLIKHGKLFQDTNGNCNFVICDWNEKPIGEEKVGTGDTRYKLISTHSGYGFHTTYGNPSDILYFESAIDLLSCYQIHQDKLHWLCVDNDTAGTNFIAEMKQQIQGLHTFQPPQNYKDWNDYLCGTGKKIN